jgi:hypothetical protein
MESADAQFRNAVYLASVKDLKLRVGDTDDTDDSDLSTDGSLSSGGIDISDESDADDTDDEESDARWDVAPFTYPNFEVMIAPYPNLVRCEIKLRGYEMMVDMRSRTMETTIIGEARRERPLVPPCGLISWPGNWTVTQRLEVELQTFDIDRWVNPLPNCQLHPSHMPFSGL